MPKLIIPPIQVIANFIEMPDIEKWRGNCYTVACKIIYEKVIDDNCRAIYGHYLGPISSKSFFAQSRNMPFVRHGWIELSNGDIIDPTRWVFENKEPYIALIDKDNDVIEEYDEGGNKWKEANIKPSPKFETTEKCFSVILNNEECKEYLNDLINKGENIKDVSLNQMFWIANLPLSILGIHAKDIFTWIQNMGLSSLIPLDNEIKIMGKN